MSAPLEHFPLVRPIKSAEEFDRLKGLAKEDQHDLAFPTFLVEKNKEIVGYVGINSIPHWHGWFSSKKMFARDTLGVVSQLENFCRMQGMKTITSFSVAESPVFAVGQKFGYQFVRDLKFSIKVL